MTVRRAWPVTVQILFSVPMLLAVLAPAPLAAQRITVGEHVAKPLETPHPYPTSGEAATAITWQDEISHPGATYIAVHFAQLELAPGDFVVVRSPDGGQRWTYRGLGKRDLGRTPGGFFAAHVKGDTAIVELHAAGWQTAYGYRIDVYGRGYSPQEIEDFWRAGMGEKMQLPYPPSWVESVCGTDDTREAKCYLASEAEAYDKGRAVARLLLSGAAHCTGWLIGCEGHLMTNEHCIGSQAQANDIDFEFMAEGATCGTNCASALACPGVVEASGGTLVAVDAALDYALVIPDTSTGSDTDLPATYGYLQLRAGGPVLGERIYIPQHPSGWGKRLAVESTHTDDQPDGLAQVNALGEPACSGGPGDVGYFADTAGGSSGSPVLAYSDHRVVALHHCRGDVACTGSAGDPNRAVPIGAVIADLGPDLPSCAVCEPPPAPATLDATPNGDNRIDLSWPAAAGATSYRVERAIGACPGAGFELLADGVVATNYSDLTVSGGTQYAYRVTAVDDGTGCESDPSPCDDATATGLCIRPPTFAGLVSAASAGTAACGVELDWDAATAHCGTAATYSVYRSTVAGFVPGAANRVASCVAAMGWTDTGVAYGNEYFYVVRAEDDSGNGAGACAAGNEDGNTAEEGAGPAGAESELFDDDVEAGTAGWQAVAGPNDGGAGTTPWSVVTTSSHSPTHAWFVADQAVVKDETLRTAGPFAIPAGAPATLELWHRFDTESTYDGGVLETSTNGGASWQDVLAGGPDRFLAGGYNATLNTGFSNPLPGRAAWSGSSGGWVRVEVDLADFAGTSLLLRWRFGCDSSVAGTGWWVDDVRVLYGSACGLEPEPPIFADGFESGDTSAW